MLLFLWFEKEQANVSHVTVFTSFLKSRKPLHVSPFPVLPQTPEAVTCDAFSPPNQTPETVTCDIRFSSPSKTGPTRFFRLAFFSRVFRLLLASFSLVGRLLLARL